MKSTKKNTKKKSSKKRLNTSSAERIARAEAEARKNRRVAAEVAHKRAQIVNARRKVAEELEKLDEALRALDMKLPPMSWQYDEEARKTFFQKGSVAGTILEILTVKTATCGEIREELRRRFPDDEFKSATIDTMLLRLKTRGFIAQDKPRGPYYLASQREAP